MFNYIKNISLPVLFCFSVLISANEVNVEVNMESILEVGRENQTLSANSQDKIEETNSTFSPEDAWYFRNFHKTRHSL